MPSFFFVILRTFFSRFPFCHSSASFASFLFPSLPVDRIFRLPSGEREKKKNKKGKNLPYAESCRNRRKTAFLSRRTKTKEKERRKNTPPLAGTFLFHSTRKKKKRKRRIAAVRHPASWESLLSLPRSFQKGEKEESEDNRLRRKKERGRKRQKAGLLFPLFFPFPKKEKRNGITGRKKNGIRHMRFRLHPSSAG